jgi:hypothetical protein
VKVTCTQGNTNTTSQSGGWANYAHLGTSSGAFKNPCSYRNTFDCRTRKWSGPRIDHWQTANPTSPLNP